MSDTTTTETMAASGALLGGKERSAGRVRVVLCFLAIYLVWGSTYLAIRYAVQTIPPLVTAGIRHTVAGGILLAWALSKGQRPTWAEIRASVVIGFFFFLLGHGSLHWAELYVPSGTASLLIAIEPLIVFLMSSAAARVWKLNGLLLAGILIGSVGVGILVQGTALQAGGRGAYGPFAVLFGAVAWSYGIIYSRRSKLFGSPLLLSALSLLAGAAMLLTTAALTGEMREFSVSRVTPKSWLALGYLIVFGSVITFTAYNWLLEHYSPTLVATHTYVNPVVAVFLGWLLAGEVITRKVGIAATLVVGAVVLVDRGTSKLHHLR
jgi:drug/metabolite transporter (DMT)-like permease